MMKNFCLIAALLCLMACKSNTSQIETKHKTFVVLFDISASIDENTRKNYLDNFKTVINAIDEGDALIAGLISDKSQSEQKFTINASMPVYISKTDNTMYEKADKEKFDKQFVLTKDSLYQCAAKMLGEREQSGYTDIFGAIMLAKKIFGSYKNDEKVLVIMSGMIQSAKDYDFEKGIPDSSKTNHIINELKTKKMMPSLVSVKIYISGANTADSHSFSKLEYFWNKYFNEAAADFSPDRFCATLINFDE